MLHIKINNDMDNNSISYVIRQFQCKQKGGVQASPSNPIFAVRQKGVLK